jgi:antitoxin VapB
MTKRKTRTGRRLSEEERYIPVGIDQPEKPVQTAKLFKNGRSQAVRLPKEFRFLTPKDNVKKENPWQDFFDALDSFDPNFEFVRDQPRHQQKRPLIESGFRVWKGARKTC